MSPSHYNLGFLNNYFPSRSSLDFFYTRDLTLYKKDINTFTAKPKNQIDNLEDFPWRASVSDQDSGLSIALQTNNHSKDWWCSRYEGFRYFVHPTNELLSTTNRFQLQFGELTELLIKPKMTITEEDLRSYALERWVWVEPRFLKFINIFYRRNCYFDGERGLRFFKQYTKYNCEQECLSVRKPKRFKTSRFLFNFLNF